MRKGVVAILVVIGIGILLSWWYVELKRRPAPSVLPVGVPEAPPPARLPARQVVKIGAVLPLSGAWEDEGQEAKKGLELAAARAEAEYGLKVELLIEDDKSDPSEAENLIRKQVIQQNVLAVITGAVKDEARAAHLAQELGAAILLLKEGDEALLAGSSYLFGLGLGPEDEAIVLARFAIRSLGLKKGGMLVDVKDASLRAVATAAREDLETAGGEVVSQVACVCGDEDFSGQINRIKVRGAEVLFVLTAADEGAKIISQARQRGFYAPILVTCRMMRSDIIGLDRKVLGNCFITQYFSSGEKRQAFVSLQESLQGEPSGRALGEEKVSDTLALAYDAFSLLAQALTQVPQPTRDTLAQTIGAIRDFPGATGTLSFKRTGAVMRDIAVVQIGGASHPALRPETQGRGKDAQHPKGEVQSRIFPSSVPEETPAPVEIELP